MSLHWLRAACAALFCSTLCACGGGPSSPLYYWQAASGQFELWRKTRPVDDVLADAGTSPALRERLLLVGKIRDFASRELALPDNASYRSYADVGRGAVVWNVVAAPALSIRPREWCMPVAGCVSYAGYFSEAAAQDFAARLKAEGLDVHVAAVPAYSTLGWFNDPLLNTFINWPETELARLIFHELAHQRVYVKNDTAFNESFATAVEEYGAGRWLAQTENAAQQAALARSIRAQAGFGALISEHRAKLAAAYASNLDDSARLDEKRRIIDALRADYSARRDAEWGGYRGYDAWFGREINNASLASVGVYRQWVPAFAHLIRQQGGDMAKFYQAALALAALAPDQRERSLQALAQEK